MFRPRPQRLFPLAPIGSMLKRVHVIAPKARVIGPEEDREYLKMVRECHCLCCGNERCGEACHVRFASAAFGKASGLQKRPADKWALPMCPDEHRLAKAAQHNRNEQEFWASYGIDALPLCVKLYERRGDLLAMRAVVLLAIAERKR